MPNLSRNEKRMPIDKLNQIAKQTNVQVDFYPLPQTKSLSAVYLDAYYIAIDPLEIQTAGEWNTHFAHELGHCATGSFYNIHAPLDVRGKHEYDADKWAVSQLIPRADLQSALRDGYKEPWQLAEFFDVTEEFIKKAFYFYYEVEQMK